MISVRDQLFVIPKKIDIILPPSIPPQRKAYGNANMPDPTALLVRVKTELAKVPLS